MTASGGPTERLRTATPATWGRTAVSLDPVLLRLRAGDQTALGELYDRTAPLAFASALQILQHEERAEDAVHDAFVTAWREVDTFKGGHSALTSWLLGHVRAAARKKRPTADR